VVIIKVNDEISVHSLLWVSELLIFLHLYKKKNFVTLTIFIVDQELLCVCVVDEPLQQFYTRKHRGSARYHVQVRLSDIWKKFSIELPHVRVSMWDIFREFLWVDLLEEFSPVREYPLAPCVFLCVSKV
jgi:hypothetical protein